MQHFCKGCDGLCRFCDPNLRHSLGEGSPNLIHDLGWIACFPLTVDDRNRRSVAWGGSSDTNVERR